MGEHLSHIATALFDERDALQARVAELEGTLAKINTIRNSIIGLQTMDWSEHIYPLVAALNEASVYGMHYPEARENFGTMLDRTNAAEARCDALRHSVAEWQKMTVGLSDSLRQRDNFIEARGLWPVFAKEWNNCYPTGSVSQLLAERELLRKALEEAQQALNTWVAIYAVNECSDEAVEEAWQRIADGGGTLAYIADVSAHIRAALAEAKQTAAGEE